MNLFLDLQRKLESSDEKAKRLGDEKIQLVSVAMATIYVFLLLKCCPYKKMFIFICEFQGSDVVIIFCCQGFQYSISNSSLP